MNEQQLSQEIEATISPARQLKVVDTPSLELANDVLKGIKDRQKAIKDFFDPLVKKAHEAHKALTSKRKEVETPLVNAETYLKREVGNYLAEQERKAREEAERIRKEEESKLEDERMKKALEAEQAGDEELAQAIIEEDVYVPPPVVEKATPKLANTSVREVWKFEVVDVMALCKAVASGSVPVQAIQANTVFIGQQARSLQSSLRYPGVRVWSEKSVAVR